MTTVKFISLDKIRNNPFQQEGVRDEAKVLEIMTSVKQNRENGTKGLLQVPTARALDDGTCELAFGHHRYYAFTELAKEDPFFGEMPLMVRELSDIEMFEMMAVENFHRRDISPIEEARTLYAYMTNFNKTSVDAARKFEKSEEYVRGAIRLLNLPESAQEMIRNGRINKSAARDLLVVEKLGGAELVDEVLHEIETTPDTINVSEVIEDTLRQSPNTAYLSPDADWVKAKKFPVKYLPKVTKSAVYDVIQFDMTGRDGTIDDVINKEILPLISAGMEVTDEAFPMVTPESLERLRVLVNPPQCEKCPLHAVLDGQQICGMPQCKANKAKAWELKKQDDEIAEIGIPLYQKADGDAVDLNIYNDADKKLVAARGADLRLKPTSFMWNNFDGIGRNFKVVLVGEAAKKRLKKLDAEEKKEQTQKEKHEIERAKRGLISKTCNRFQWEVASLAFESLFDGFGSMNFLLFTRLHVVAWFADEYDYEEIGIDEGKYIQEAEKAKKADGLKAMRRLIAHHVIEQAMIRKGNLDLGAKQPIVQFAKTLEGFAQEWEVKLPKDFMTQAETFQTELDAALKEIGKS